MERLAVFDDTPLASHLSSAGMEDWGIDETPMVAPRRTNGPAASLRPLKLSESSSFVVAAKFRALVRSALVSAISPREAILFSEQFRYQLVSSNLLEQRPIYARWSGTTSERRLDLLYSHKGPWDMIAVPIKYWASGGGCIVLVVSLLAWKSRHSSNGKLSLVLGLLTLLYLVSCAKRRTLRLLHRKCLVQISILCHNSKLLDGDIVRALQSVQRSDQLAAGAGARQLRVVLASSLSLLLEQYLDAIKDCFSMCSELDLQQYWHVYDMAAAQQQLGFVINDNFIGFEPTQRPVEAAHSLGSLKLEFQKIHFLRRAFMCILLTVGASPETTLAELEKWTVVCDQTTQISDFAAQVSTLVTKDRLQQTEEQAPQGDKSVINLSLVSQHVAARLDLLANASLGSDEYTQTVDQISTDLAILNQMWAEKNRHARVQAVSATTSAAASATAKRRASLTPSTPDTLIDNETFEYSDSKHIQTSTPMSTPATTPATTPASAPSQLDRSEFMLELSNVLRKRNI